MTDAPAPLRVLMVEDSPGDAELVQRELRRAGYAVAARRVDAAEDMRLALQEGPWDLVLADYRIPGFGGREALRLLQTSGRDLPFILVSGAIGEEAAVALMKAGAHDYVAKGNLTRLGAVVERELREARLRRERREALAALEASRQGLERAQALARIGSWEWDLSKPYQVWTPELFRIFALDPAIGPPDSDRFISMVHPADRPAVLAAIETLIAEGNPQELEYRITDAGGEAHHLHERAELDRDASGRPVLLRGTIQDITERVRMEALLQDLGRMSAKGKLAAYLAHEINNPLAGIRNAFELVARAVPEGHPHAHYAALIRQEIERIADLIRTLYQVYRPPAREAQAVPLAQAFEDLAKLLEPKCLALGVRLEPERPEQGLAVHLNEGMLRQVLFNLAINALDASPRGGAIQLRAEAQSGATVISVVDGGPGIPPELAERIFEPGFTTKRDSDQAGLGLGLATCRNLVRAMGGTLSFTDGPGGRGTEFRIRLPRAESEDIATGGATRERPA